VTTAARENVARRRCAGQQAGLGGSRGLAVLLEHWDGGERGQRAPAPGGGGNGGGGSGGARGTDRRAFISCSA
jgi:hypothetical protein